ncbi:hypothetical protein OESDEN_12992, partial [Oesophagostomum dentatum]
LLRFIGAQKTEFDKFTAIREKGYSTSDARTIAERLPNSDSVGTVRKGPSTKKLVYIQFCPLCDI